jgi:hypothetical protein
MRQKGSSMSPCLHTQLKSWVIEGTQEPAGVWSCADCGHKFVPLDLEKEAQATRYQFLRNDFSPMGLNIDGNHAWSYRRNATLKGPSLDSAIDAAMATR